MSDTLKVSDTFREFFRSIFPELQRKNLCKNYFYPNPVTVLQDFYYITSHFLNLHNHEKKKTPNLPFYEPGLPVRHAKISCQRCLTPG